MRAAVARRRVLARRRAVGARRRVHRASRILASPFFAGQRRRVEERPTRARGAGLRVAALVAGALR